MLNDLRFAIRMLAKNPGFTAVAVLSLALGIGANSAIFSVLSATLLRERPYPKDPDRVFNMMVFDLKKTSWEPQTLTNYLYWKDHNQVFEHLAAWKQGSFIFTGREKSERVTGAYVSANFFSAFGAQAVLGRIFLPEENQPGNEYVCVLSDGLWKRRFGSDTNLIGKLLTLNGEGFTVVGILPANFPYSIELWVPMVFGGKNLTQMPMISRLKRNVTLEQARINMNLLNLALKEQYPQETDAATDLSKEAPAVEYRADGKIPRPDRKGGWVVDFFPVNPGVPDYWENALYLLQCTA
ncbi:MAG: hypothetical protein DMG05_18040, partial [Acidobacteria bacterium]